MRGGTSKAVFLREADVPREPGRASAHRSCAIFGSPDERQIDGLGGADPLTSKVAIIGPPRADNPRAAATHLTYTFGQVAIDEPDIDYLSLCGNISSAVGAFAIAENLVEPTEPVTIVRVYNTNLDRVLTLEVPVCRRPSGRTRRLLGAGRSRHRRDDPGRFGRHGRRAQPERFCPQGRPLDRLDVPGVGTDRRVARGHRQCARVRAGARRRSGWHRDRRARSTPTTSCGSAWSAFAARPAARWA